MAFTRIGYGQVEENQLSAPRTGAIFASLPLDPKVNVLQQGEFMYYDYADNMVTAEPVKGKIGEPMLVFNEIKIYEDKLSYKDFAMIRLGDNYVTNRPAVGALTSLPIQQYDQPATADLPVRKAGEAADVYGGGARNTGVNPAPAHTEYGYRMDGIAPRLFKTAIGDIMTTNMVKLGVDYAVGDMLVPKLDSTSHTLVLEKSAAEAPAGMVWIVAKVYTMPDGQPGLKLQRVQ